MFGLLTLNTILWFMPLFLLAIVKLAVPLHGPRVVVTRLLMGVVEHWISVNAWILGGVGSRDWVADVAGELDRRGWYLVVSNHQSWVDIVVLQTAFNRRIPLLKFFLKQELIWFPLLGFGFWALDMPFMRRHSPSYLAAHPGQKGRDLEATRKACQKFRHTPTSVINFVEGTRFSEEKRQKKVSPFRNLLLPRAGGVAIALSAMGELFDAVLDVTLIYPDGVPSFWGMCCGDRVRVALHADKLPVDASLVAGDYQNDRQYRREVHRWLTGLWQRKDRRISKFRQAEDAAALTPVSL